MQNVEDFTQDAAPSIYTVTASIGFQKSDLCHNFYSYDENLKPKVGANILREKKSKKKIYQSKSVVMPGLFCSLLSLNSSHESLPNERFQRINGNF